MVNQSQRGPENLPPHSNTFPLVTAAWTYLRYLARRFAEDRCMMVAGSLTFTTLLSLVPLFTISITLTSEIGLTKDLVAQVKSFLLKTLVPEVSGRLIGVYMEQFAQNTARLTYFGLAFVIFTAVALMLTIDGVFNAIWRARSQRHLLRRALGYFAVLTLGPILVGGGLLLSRQLIKWSHRLESTFPLLDDWLIVAVPILLTAAALALAYRVIPRRHVPTRHAVFGGLVAAMLLEVMKYLFIAYVKSFGTYSVVYGAFASVPIFLMWLYVCWVVVLFGAEVTATLSYVRHGISGERTPAREEARQTLVLEAFQAQGAQMTMEQIRHHVRLPIDLTEDAIDALVERGDLSVTRHRARVPRYVLTPARDQDA